MDDCFVLRPFAPADQQAARRLIQEGLGEHFGYIDETMNPDIEDIQATYVEAGHVFIVVTEGACLVATGALLLGSDGVGQMVRVSVAQAYRRHGIARSVVEHLNAIARQRGMRRLQVETNKDWWDAIGLYRNSGFRLYGSDEVSVYMAMDFAGQPTLQADPQSAITRDQPTLKR